MDDGRGVEGPRECVLYDGASGSSGEDVRSLFCRASLRCARASGREVLIFSLRSQKLNGWSTLHLSRRSAPEARQECSPGVEAAERAAALGCWNPGKRRKESTPIRPKGPRAAEGEACQEESERKARKAVLEGTGFRPLRFFCRAALRCARASGRSVLILSCAYAPLILCRAVCTA
jgi:hypothetical protein